MPLALNKTTRNKNKRIAISHNRYRNAHFFESNRAKKEYKKIVMDKLPPGLFQSTPRPFGLQYTLYANDNRKLDLTNWCCIHSKFFLDALVDMGIIEDDNTDYINKEIYIRGGVDSNNGRIEITIL